jgi:HD-GYP domain-containing protein (c-di-GMP phosphodiesterase class II)
LFRRLATAALLVAVALSALLFARERGRLGEVAIERARIAALFFNVEVRPLLDQPGAIPYMGLQKEVEKYVWQSAQLGYGRFVYVDIVDRSGATLGRIDRDDYALMEAVRDFVQSSRLPSFPSKDDYSVESVQIGGVAHVHVALPLTTTAGAVAAYGRGVFAVSPDAIRDIQRNLLRTIAAVVGLVLLTTALLYPTILRLLRRVTRLSWDLLDANVTAIRLLGSAIAKRDSDTDLHNCRVTIYAVRLAEAAGLTNEAIRALIKGAFLHDVGKIGISDNILLKPDRLTENEFEEMKKHVQYGMDIIRRSTWLKDAADVVGYHHEQYDGSGYLAGLKGEQIPLAARIFAIADVFDALTSHRPYKAPLSFEEAMNLLEDGRERHFDPKLLDLFRRIARPLYDEFGNRDDEHPRLKVLQIGERYFKQELDTLWR